MFKIDDVISCDFDKLWMQHAINLATYAEYIGEVSVGAVLVFKEDIIGEGWNSSISCCDPTAHAEIMALRQGGKTLGNYRLLNTTLYVTLEPCIMCLGAMVHARISRLVFGASNKKSSVLIMYNDILNKCNINHDILYTSGVLAESCSDQIIDFFYRRRMC